MPLGIPIGGNGGEFLKPFDIEVDGLAAFENGLGNIRCEKCQRQELGNVGSVEFGIRRQGLDRNVIILCEGRPPRMGSLNDFD